MATNCNDRSPPAYAHPRSNPSNHFESLDQPPDSRMSHAVMGPRSRLRVHGTTALADVTGPAGSGQKHTNYHPLLRLNYA
jgi:hypothetical protein